MSKKSIINIYGSFLLDKSEHTIRLKIENRGHPKKEPFQKKSVTFVTQGMVGKSGVKS